MVGASSTTCPAVTASRCARWDATSATVQPGRSVGVDHCASSRSSSRARVSRALASQASM
ncbi:hypothetical protein ASF38_04095 [Aeromicrobium sp. Leaf272]|nr:hypothetical protein ASF38_04095 [Aeromicrobium sp. Leaf272]